MVNAKGKRIQINQIDKNVWECNGLWIEKILHDGSKYVVEYYADNIVFCTLAEAVDFCMMAE